MADPDRIAAWNAQVERWADASTTVDLLEYAAPLVAYEEQNGTIRTDGVHPEIDPLTDLARQVFVPRRHRPDAGAAGDRLRSAPNPD